VCATSLSSPAAGERVRIGSMGTKHLARMVAGWLAVAVSLAPVLARGAECGPTAYDCALYYVGRQDFTAAIRSLRRVLQREPRNLKALNLLGIALTGAGQIEQANREFKKALRLNPRFIPALKNLAINELTLKRTAEAKTHSEQVLKHAPEDEVAHISLAEIYFAEKQCESALKHYEKSRVRVVNNPDLIFHYSHCAFEQGRPQQAITMLDLLPAGDGERQFQAGVMLAQAEAYTEAARRFGLARQGYSDPYTAGYNQALAYMKAGDSLAAIRTVSELFTEGYQRAELYNLVSQAYLENGQLQEAYDALRRATQIDPKDENNYLDLTAICLDYENYDLGIEIADTGLRHVPDSYRLYLQRGVLRRMKGQITDAEKDFATAQKLAPQKTLPYVALAITWMLTGQIQEAISVLRERAKLTPDDFLTQYLLGEVLVRSGAQVGSDTEREALTALEASVRLNPSFVHSHVALGKTLLKRGEVDRAIDELEKALALDPSEVTAAFQLSGAYRRKGALARAEELMARVKRLHALDREGNPDKPLKRLLREGVPEPAAARNHP